jgi:hypothetical protein
MKATMMVPATMNQRPEPGPNADLTAPITRGMNPKVSASSPVFAIYVTT